MRHQDQNAVNQAHFGKQAPAYAKLARGDSRDAKSNSTEALLDALNLSADDDVLDVGCGPGRLTIALAKRARHATGIDITPEMLDQARAAQAEHQIRNMTWLQGDILPLPFADASFAAVVSQATFHHFADPAAVLAEMVRVCRPSGHVAVIDLSPEPEKIEEFDRVERLRDPSHVATMGPETLRALGRSAGLEEIASETFLSRFPAEAIFATSVCSPQALEEVRAIYRDDAASRTDRCGLKLCEDNGVLYATYPMAMAVWRRP